MWLIVRFGVHEMLEYLSSFCNFYVYSHGFKEYIMEILNKIDPEEKYFKNREQTVVAPKDQVEQQMMNLNRKRFTDFRDLGDRTKPLFSAEDLDRTLVIDDQYCAIHDKAHLVMSKKFLKFSDKAPFASRDKRANWSNYQYPMPPPGGPHGLDHLILREDETKAHQVRVNPMQILNILEHFNHIFLICRS